MEGDSLAQHSTAQHSLQPRVGGPNSAREARRGELRRGLLGKQQLNCTCTDVTNIVEWDGTTRMRSAGQGERKERKKKRQPTRDGSRKSGELGKESLVYALHASIAIAGSGRPVACEWVEESVGLLGAGCWMDKRLARSRSLRCVNCVNSVS